MLNFMKYFNHSEVYDSIKTCSQSRFSTKESINTCDTVVTLRSYSDLVFFAISKLQHRNWNSISIYCMLLLLDEQYKFKSRSSLWWSGATSKWMEYFNSRGIHFIHLNVKTLLPKINELRNIAKLSNAAVISISESKLYDSVHLSEKHLFSNW